MSRTAVITQPTYLPWLGYFEQIAKSDVFIFLDTVQFVRRSWHSRNRLKGSNNQLIWLTVPVISHPQKTPLLKIQISQNQPQWRRKHLGTIEACLGNSPYFKSVFPFIQEWINYEYKYLADLNIAGIKMFSDLLGLSSKFIRASELNPQGKRTELLVNLCKQLNVDRYYSSIGSKVYLDEEDSLFIDAGIQLNYQAWEHPIYPQLSGDFVSHLSVLDAIMNLGSSATRSMIVPK